MADDSAPLDYHDTRAIEGGASYSLFNRLYRVSWNATWLVFASWTPTPLHRWRNFLLRLFGANVHPTAHVYSSARIWLPVNLTMEEHTCLGPGANCYNMAEIRLANHAIVSQGACLCAGTHDVDDVHFQLLTKPIVLEEYAWIAAEAFVGPGVTIGHHAVVGARGVLFRDAKPNGIYAGNPARLVRERKVTNGSL